MKIHNDTHIKSHNTNVAHVRPGFTLPTIIYEPTKLSQIIYDHLSEQLEKRTLIRIDEEYGVDLEFSPESDQDTGNVFEIWIYYNNALLVTCKYLHELQNIYFSILKKELIINFDEINLNLYNPFLKK